MKAHKLAKLLTEGPDVDVLRWDSTGGPEHVKAVELQPLSKLDGEFARIEDKPASDPAWLIS